jgi:thymidine phosphorylase
VGDKVSFLLAPIAAACGCFVPMISGRGLGHTGGTTDKVESIPGYQSTPDFDLFRKVVREVGCSIIGQTADLAPADRRLYAIRDITGTVESIPLITASILSKKIAAGLEGLVMDVKTGNGAFMESEEKARGLAESIIKTAASAGLKSRAVITNMNEVLGHTAGNALEIEECVRFLKNEDRHPALEEVTFALVAEMLLVGGIESERAAALNRVRAAVESGDAAERFSRMVSAMGGPNDFLERSGNYLARAPEVREIRVDGYLAAVDTRAIGNAIIELGGGRRKLGEALDLSVGFSGFADIGDHLGDDKPLATIHAATADDAKRVTALLKDACSVSNSSVSKGAAIIDIIR